MVTISMPAICIVESGLTVAKPPLTISHTKRKKKITNNYQRNVSWKWMLKLDHLGTLRLIQDEAVR
jgi:hypothetical protein